MSNSPKIIQVYPEKGNMGKVLPEYLSEWTTKKVRDEGAEVVPEAFVTGVNMENGQLAIKLNNGNVVCIAVLFYCEDFKVVDFSDQS